MKDNKPKKMPMPVKLILCLVDRGDGKIIEMYLNDHHLNGGILLMGKGTAESDIADMFGFGLCDRDIVACLVPVNKLEKTMKDINEITRIEQDKYGLNMILDVQSMASNMLEFLKVAVN